MQTELRIAARMTWPGTALSRKTSTADIGGFCISEQSCSPGRELIPPDGERASIFFAAQGSFTEESGNQRVRREEFDVLLRPSGRRASLRANEHGARCIVIELSPERLADVQAVAALFRSPFDAPEAGARALARRLSREVDREWPSKLRIEAMILELLAHLARLDPVEPDWARSIAHAAECMTAASEMSRAVGVSALDISRYVRRRHGCTVPEYLRRCRIVAAAEALATSSVSIAQISTEFGFYDQSHFSKTFKSEMGVTPRQYRVEFGRR